MKRSLIWYGCGLFLAANAWSEGVLMNDEYVVQYGQQSQLDILTNDQLPTDSEILNINFEPASIEKTIYGFSPTLNKMIFFHHDQNFTFVNIRYTVSYKIGQEIMTESAHVTIKSANGSSENSPPIAADDFYYIKQNTTHYLSPLDNDFDLSGDTIRLTAIADVINGEALLFDNQIEFTPTKDFTGLAYLSYTIENEKGESAQATIHIFVEHASSPNTPPVAVDDEIKLAPGQTVVVDVLKNDTDTDGDLLYISALTNHAPELQTSIVDDQISISASQEFTQATSITYQVNDGSDDSNQATVHVIPDIPNQAPIANNDAVTIGTTDPISIQPLNNDSDAEDGIPTLSQIISVDHGSASISGDDIIYTPPEGTFNIANIVYEVSDSDGATDQATIIISQLINLPPTARDDSAMTISGRSIAIAALNNDEDEDPATLSTTILEAPLYGSVSLSDNIFTYTSDTDFSGDDTFIYQLTDDIGQSSSASVNIVVSENYPPIAINDFRNTAIDTPLLINVLLNDTDNNDDTLNIDSIFSSSPGGDFSLTDNNEILFEPSSSFSGEAVATYTVTDLSNAEASAVLRIRVHEDSPTVDEIQLTNIDPALIPKVVSAIHAGDFGSFNAMQSLGDITGNGTDNVSLNLQETIEVNGTTFNQRLLLEGSGLTSLSYQDALTALPDSSLTKIYSSNNLLNEDLAPVAGKFDTDSIVDIIFSKLFGLVGYLVSNPTIAEMDISNMPAASAVSSMTPKVQSIHSLDFNGDGIDDLAVVLAGVNTSEPSKVRVLFGPLLPFSSDALSDTLDSTHYLDIEGFSASSELKKPLAVTSGDFNGDGFSDILIGQYDSDRAITEGKGAVLLAWGGNNIRQNINLDDLEAGIDASRATLIYSGLADDTAIGGFLISGDVNADGVDDIILGNSLLNMPDPSRQMDSATVIYGGFTANDTLSVEHLLQTKNSGYHIRKDQLSGTQIFSETILSITVADINGDKYDDISLLTSRGLSTLKGDDKIKPRLIDLGQKNTALDVLYTDTLGLLPSVETADINGDGFFDILISDDYRTGEEIKLIYGGIHFR